MLYSITGLYPGVSYGVSIHDQCNELTDFFQSHIIIELSKVQKLLRGGYVVSLNKARKVSIVILK